MVERNKNLLKNRHMLFEAVTHYMLNDAFKRFSTHPLRLALSDADDSLGGTVRSVMWEVSYEASRRGLHVNRALERLMADPNLNDPEYALEQDREYDIAEAVDRAGKERPRELEEFVAAVGNCLRNTGRVTRFCVRRMELM